MPTVDLLVIGGGIHGACVARDAALRGLSVTLVEKDDLASGTSSRSSKLIHGGIRYLETGQFGLVREALREREILLRTAPGHVRPLTFLLPFYEGDARPSWVLRAGLALYDLLGASSLGAHRIIGRDEARATVPSLPVAGLAGAALFHDLQMDDAGLVVANAIAAQSAGATIRTHVAVEALEAGPPWRATLAGGEELEARVVINAAGPWVDAVRAQAGAAPVPSLRLTRGTHVVLPAIEGTHGLLLFSRADGRVFFVLPWPGGSLVGTTDTDDAQGPDRVAPAVEDVHYLWREIAARWPDAHPERTTDRVFAGLRPLARGSSDRPWDNSREARLLVEHDMISLVGGKFTTARHLAERAVDRAIAMLGKNAPRCTTATAPLPSPLRDPFLPLAHDLDEVAVQQAIDRQFARRLDDVIFRRTPLWRFGATARAIAPMFGEWMGRQLHWSREQQDAEVRFVQAKLDAEAALLARARETY